jgi:hypothetical protein
MATQNFINECKNRANANRLGRFSIGSLDINQTNYLTSLEVTDSCYNNNTIIGTTYTRSADIKLLNLPADTELVGKTINPEVGVKYLDDSTEYIRFDSYIIESLKDEQTASNTEFTAITGSSMIKYKSTRSYNLKL